MRKFRLFWCSNQEELDICSDFINTTINKAVDPVRFNSYTKYILLKKYKISMKMFMSKIPFYLTTFTIFFFSVTSSFILNKLTGRTMS